MTIRITSACAEQTPDSSSARNSPRDYLRVCGADPVSSHTNEMKAGLPPRVRSRPMPSCNRSSGGGITSACAEQTLVDRLSDMVDADYLRVCGADSVSALPVHPGNGLPPRVRSRLGEISSISARAGITSACAEQTVWMRMASSSMPDYLRVCGADDVGIIGRGLVGGLPPRVRSRPGTLARTRLWSGITSACAEQIATGLSTACRSGDYLRVCGADHGTKSHDWHATGLPPRVRSRPRSIRGLR